MPDTAHALGLATFLPDERTDPQKSARAAGHYLRSLFDKFGSWPLALAAYNAGEGRVSRLLASRGATDFAGGVVRVARGDADVRPEGLRPGGHPHGHRPLGPTFPHRTGSPSQVGERAVPGASPNPLTFREDRLLTAARTRILAARPMKPALRPMKGSRWVKVR
jgi:hypothetical protein